MILAIYIITTIVIFTLMHIFEVDGYDLQQYIGNWGSWLFVIIFFVPLVIHKAWLKNWYDCETNDLINSGHYRFIHEKERGIFIQHKWSH